MASFLSRRSRARRAWAKRKRPDWVPSIEVAEREIGRVRLMRYKRHRQNVLMFIALFALAVGFAAFRLCFDLVEVQGVGMDPTLKSGSLVLCVKQHALDQLVGLIPEDVRRIERGDLVLIDYKIEPDGVTYKKTRSLLLIKRAVALGGDELSEDGGDLIVSGSSDLGKLVSSDLVFPVTVPTGFLFALGDNHELSVDSRQRAFGMVAEADVVARPVAVVWPVYAMGIVK